MPVIATAGHVDHGKSTLVRALTGTDPDRLAEERRRGLTLDLGFAWTDIEGERFSFVDVPGHERYVETMLAGVGPAIAVMFVVAADEGWRRQTQEHADLLAALRGVHVLLAVTRSDLADPQPALHDSAMRLAGLGVPPVAEVAVSAVSGSGLDDLRAGLRSLSGRLPRVDPDAPVRLWLDRRFSVAGSGTVVTGTLTEGTLRVGDVVQVAGHEAVIRGLHSSNSPVSQVRGPARVAVALRGVPRQAVRRGDVLASPGVVGAVSEVEVDLPSPIGRLPRRLTAHVGTAALPVDVHVRPDGTALLRLRAERTAPLLLGDRLVLRDPGSHAVGGGVDVTHLGRRPPTPARRAEPAGHDSPSLTGHPGLLSLLARLAVNPLDAPSAEQLATWEVDPRGLADAEAAGRLVRLRGAVVGPDAVARAVEVLATLPSPFTAGDACRALKVSRRVGIPLLERLDATHATRRWADGTRTLRP